jgi:hypothetical protein
MKERLVKSFNAFVNESVDFSPVQFDRDEYDRRLVQSVGKSPALKSSYSKIINNFSPVAVKHHVHETTVGSYYSVLVKDENSEFSAWVDVSISRDDVEADWNMYIFDMTDPADVLQKRVQDNDDVFDYATSEAVQYLENLGLINNGVGGWSYGSDRGHLRESKEDKKEFKVGKNYEVDVKSASKVLMAQQMPILKQMIKNNGDGKVYIVSVSNSQVEIAGSKNDALIGTLKIKPKDAEQFIKM